MRRFGAAWSYLAAAIALAGVAIHLAAIFGGAEWHAYFGAPPVIVESARAGTWLAPVSCAVIAALMGLCAAYALSALGVIRRLPLLRFMLAAMALVCLVRALILVPLAISHPELRNAFEIGAAFVWGLAGAGFAVAWGELRRKSASLAADDAARIRAQEMIPRWMSVRRETDCSAAALQAPQLRARLGNAGILFLGEHEPF